MKIHPGWDRSFLTISSTLAEPLCSAYGLLRYRLAAPLDPDKFDNCKTKTREIAYRTLIASGALFGVYLFAAMPALTVCGLAALAGGSKLLRAIGFALQKEGFTHVLGEAAEKPFEGTLKMMSWNVCGIAGGFHYDHGGVVDWRPRLDGIVKKIEREDPDVLALQEIYDAALGEALIARLKDRYAHFYFHLGKAVMGSVGGCMILSKYPVHRFSNTDFTTNDWTLKRGFAALEIKRSSKDTEPVACLIGTHLMHGEAKEVRAKQVSQIVNYVALQRLNLPTVLAGDLNIERDGEEGKTLLPHLRHGHTENKPTSTNRLVWQWDRKAQSVWNETIDYISLFKSTAQGVKFKDCHISPAYDETYDTKTALSDHHAVVATIEFARKNSI